MVAPVRLFQHGRFLIDSGLGFARGIVPHRYLKDVFTVQTQVTQKDFPGLCPQVIGAIQESIGGKYSMVTSCPGMECTIYWGG